jgi:hypothetical protein
MPTIEEYSFLEYWSGIYVHGIICQKSVKFLDYRVDRGSTVLRNVGAYVSVYHAPKRGVVISTAV